MFMNKRVSTLFRSDVMLNEVKHPDGLGFSRGMGCFG